MKPLSRRSVIAGSAAAVTAIPTLGLCKDATEGASSELVKLIATHRAAYYAFGEAIDRHAAADEALKNSDTIVPCLLGGGYSLKNDYGFCREYMGQAYQRQRDNLKQMERIAPDVAKQYRAAIKAKEKENLKILNRMWKETGVPAADHAYGAASEAEAVAFEAVCAYRCQTRGEAKLKAEYLLSTADVSDNWGDEAKALLESFV